MAGRIAIDEEPHERWDRFALEFTDGTRLALHDRRRLGRAVLEPDHSRLGPDAAEVGAAEFARRIGAGRAPLKARLSTRAACRGSGTCWPTRSCGARAWRRSARSCLRPSSSGCTAILRGAIADSIELGGAHTGRFVAARGRAGHCPLCGTPLERATIGGRTTYWCPKHQN